MEPVITGATGSISYYKWYFGDGETSGEEKLIHIYKAAGTYRYKLYIADSSGATASVTGTYTVREWGDYANGIDISLCDTSYALAITKEQGIGFSKNTGQWCWPGARNNGCLRVTDANGHWRQLQLDETDGRWYEIATRIGPTGSGLSKVWEDKTP
jgi:PKD repeat protein